MENKRLKILHVITSLRTGGAERLMVDLLPRMQEAGHQVDLCVFDGIRTPFTETLEKKGVKIISLSHSMYSPVNIIKLVPLIRKYDIIHTHNTPCQFAVALLKAFTQAALVTTEHSTNNRRRGHFVWQWIDQWMYGCYKKIICVSGKTRDALVAYLHVKKNITVIRNGIDIQSFCNTTPATRSNSFIITMVAGFRYEKDQMTVIQAITKLPNNYHLQLVGDGEKRLEYEELVNRLGIKDKVDFLGTRGDVPQILQNSDVVVLSSHREGLSLSCLEGMASGKPFVASDVEGLHEVVSGYGLLFPHGDAEALAKILVELHDSNNLSSQITKQCQERASQYSIEHTVCNYLNIYTGICK